MNTFEIHTILSMMSDEQLATFYRLLHQYKTGTYKPPKKPTGWDGKIYWLDTKTEVEYDMEFADRKREFDLEDFFTLAMESEA